MKFSNMCLRMRVYICTHIQELWLSEKNFNPHLAKIEANKMLRNPNSECFGLQFDA